MGYKLTHSDSLILYSVNICSILLNCVSSYNYTWSVDNHTYIHRHTYMRAVICNREHVLGGCVIMKQGLVSIVGHEW